MMFIRNSFCNQERVNTFVCFLMLIGITWFGGSIEKARAEELPQEIGVFQDWKVYKVLEDDKIVSCYMLGKPSRKLKKLKKRNENYLLVMHRLTPMARNLISFSAGYSIKPGTKVGLIFQNQTLDLFPSFKSEGQDTAWAPDESTQSAIVNALKSEQTVQVEATSEKGVKTQDVYSLKGFASAYNAMTKACFPHKGMKKIVKPRVKKMRKPVRKR
jgi:hypothetical protein